jgi:hypothetical protein
LTILAINGPKEDVYRAASGVLFGRKVAAGATALKLTARCWGFSHTFP